MIQIKKDTAKRLKELKEYNKQSYDEIINHLILEIKAEPLSAKEKKDVEEALEDVRAGRVYPIEDVAKELGVRLKS